jgi:hypothetical protein
MRDNAGQTPPLATTTAGGIPGGAGAWAYALLVLASGWALFVGFRPAALPPSQGVVDPWWIGWTVLGLALGWLVRRLRRAGPATPLPLRATGERLPAALPLLDEPALALSPTWRRFAHSMFDPLRFDPATLRGDDPPPAAAVEAIARLEQLQPLWSQAQAGRVARAHRLLWLDAVLALCDHGVMRQLPDGRPPDVAALRTERLLLAADAGPAVLAEVPALFARRMRAAMARVSPAQRAAVDVQCALLEVLQPLLAEERALHARAQVILALAWNAQVDLDQVEVGYALAEAYRADLRGWLRRAAAVSLPGGGTLDATLLERCDAAGCDSADAIIHVEALRPLHAGLPQMLHAALEVLVALADGVERSGGLLPLRAGQDASA